MSKRSLFLIAALGLLTSLSEIGTANAGSITQTFSAPSTQVPFTYTAYANQFNPSLGTLTSVVITVTSDIMGQVTVVNFNPTAQPFSNATSSVPVALAGPNGLSLAVTATTSAQSAPPLADVPASFQVSGYTIPGTVSLPGETVTASVSTTLTTPADLAPYTAGITPLPFVFSASQGTYSGSGITGVSFGGSATADATITVVYNFVAAVPEPASMGLLGIGMAGFFAFRRFFKRNTHV